jgi:hypothetical protein
MAEQAAITKITCVKDSSWRGSDYHVIVPGDAYLDFKAHTVIAASFDGHGHCSVHLAGVPDFLWDDLFGDLKKGNKSKEVTNPDVIQRLVDFFRSRRSDISTKWHEVFEEYGLL